MVIATEACYAAAVMFPFGFMAQTAGDIVHRADVCTDATLDATLVPDVEWLVSNQVIQKVFTYDSGVYSRPAPFMEHENMVLPFFYNRDILLQVLRSLLLLGPFFLLLVYVHERQSHVRLGHNQRESCIQMQARLLQIVPQVVGSLANRVARCANGVHIFCRTLDHKMLYKAAHNDGRAPAVNGKAEAYSLMRFRGKREISVNIVGNEDELVVERLRYCFGRPCCIACAREVKYHVS